jgi:hypothetical protein
MSKAKNGDDPFQRVLHESERRSTRKSQLDVVDVSPSPSSSTETHLIGAPGAMTVFIGRKGTGAIDNLKSAILNANGDPNMIRDALQGVNGATSRGDQLADEMIESPVFADIRYAGEILNRGVHVSEGSRLSVAVFPYNGGRLVGDGFNLVEYYRPDSDVELEGVVVQVAPILTAAEKSALAKAPDDQSARNVGAGLWCETTWWDIAYLAVSVTAAVACAVLAVAPDEPEGHLPEEQLSSLDPASSAQQLLALRRKLLMQGYRQ